MSASVTHTQGGHKKRTNNIRPNAKLQTSHNTVCTYGRPMEYGRPLYFCPVVSSSSFFLSFFPRLILAVADWMSAVLPRMVWT